MDANRIPFLLEMGKKYFITVCYNFYFYFISKFIPYTIIFLEMYI